VAAQTPYKLSKQGAFLREMIRLALPFVNAVAMQASVESVWVVLKRGLHGVYHHAGPKHLDRYVQEVTFRLNDGNVKRHTMARLPSTISPS
jgi:hypothetical protein